MQSLSVTRESNQVPAWPCAILESRLTTRCPVRLVAPGTGDLELVLALDQGVGREGYLIEDAGRGRLRVAGAGPLGLLAGVGRLLRTGRFGPDGFHPGPWRGTSVPQKEVRGIYFATHFHNYYHQAPLAELERYVEDLALWGLNALNVWFDMHHYAGMRDPQAQAMVGRLRAVLGTAKRLGMRTGLGVLGNEAYANSPPQLRADGRTGRSHYGVELCPSKAGAPELMLQWFEEEFQAFADLRPDFLWIGPYDQGGCACDACRPWGANGFLRMGRLIAPLFRKYSPQGKVVLLTWLFDYGTPQGEWEGLARQIDCDRAWIDYILADAHELQFPEYPRTHGAPGGLPLVNFPEISMYGMVPYGGFGANPQPGGLQRLWDNVGPLIAGGWPYSEGIYEDLNKAIMAQFYWDGRPAAETVQEYIAYEFGTEFVAGVAAAIRILEANQIRHWEPDDYQRPLLRCRMPPDRGAAEALQRLLGVDARLPEAVRRGWRWRLLLLRALIDDELFRQNGLPSPACEPWFEELVRLYRADRADWVVHPPTLAERNRRL